MPLLQPGSRSARWQARNARVQVAEVEQVVGDVSVAVTAAETAAGIAQGAADDAQDAAEQATAQVGLVFTFQQVRDSYADDDVLSATIATTATIAIAAHQRHYLNSAAVDVDAGTVAGLAADTLYQVWYDDPLFAGGAVTFNVSTSIDTALASLDHPARHFVGEVKTPVSGGTATTGAGGAGRPYWKPSAGDIP